MVFNHVKTAIRQAAKYKGYTAINLAGLIVGLSSCMLILLWLADETAKDQFHEKSDRLYQVWRNILQSNGDVQTTKGIPLPLENVLRSEYPEIEAVTSFTWEIESMFRVGDVSSFEKGRFATPGFFDVFTFPLITGDPKKVLVEKPTMVISDRMALKFFGTRWQENAIGQTVKVDEEEEYEVTGIFHYPEKNSSFQFDWLIAAEGFIERHSWTNSWYNGGFSMFFALKPGASAERVRKRIEQEVIKNTSPESKEPLYIQLYAENYLHGTFENGIPVGGRIQYVRILSVIAIFLLLLASINFMNLATARASLRVREIGVRKVMGAQRWTLSQQFFTEAMLYALAAMVLASSIVYLLLPHFNALTSKSIVIDFADPRIWLTFGSIIVLTGLLSGAYPSFMLSTFPVAKSLRGRGKHVGGKNLRHVLVAFQFCIAIFLIGGTFVISKQLSYILNKDIGLQRSNLVNIDLRGDLYEKKEAYLNSLRSIPEVSDVTLTSANPINFNASTGGANWPGKDPNMLIEINVLSVGEDFVRTMGIKMEKGENFSNVFLQDSARFLINEELANVMGFDDPIGKELTLWGTRGTIIGVIQNFHMASMYDPIAPLVIRYNPKDTDVAFMRITGDTQKALTSIEQVTKTMNPEFPFRYNFLDDEFARQYQAETSVSILVNIFAGVSIFIACLGLLGLSSFAADQRAKEIGVRKVHGASTGSLMLLLSTQYAKLMIVAFIMATPLSYFFMQHWLSDFAYRIDLDVTVFVMAGVITFVIGALTVSYKSYAAALTNPAKTLKEE